MATVTPAGPQPLTQSTVKARKRPPIYIAAAIIFILIAALAAWAVVNALQKQTEVVQVRDNIARGQVIAADDLGPVTVGNVGNVPTVPADQLGSLVGKHATRDLTSGSLLTPGSIGATTLPDRNASLIGLRLTGAQIASVPLAPGSRLQLVVTPPENADPSFQDTYSGRAYAATLVEAAASPDGAATTATVQVTSDTAKDAALLAAAGRLAVTKEAD